MDDFKTETCGKCKFFFPGALPPGPVDLDAQRPGTCRKLPPAPTRMIDGRSGKLVGEYLDYIHPLPEMAACSLWEAGAGEPARNGILTS